MRSHQLDDTRSLYTITYQLCALRQISLLLFVYETNGFLKIGKSDGVLIGERYFSTSTPKYWN